MGDNELLEEVVSPTESQSVDLSPIINSLNDLIVTQGEIIENQKKIIDYFVPTEEELIQLEKDKQDELEILATSFPTDEESLISSSKVRI